MPQATQSTRPTITIYYDGTCPLCTTLIDNVGSSSKADDFTLHDITYANLPSHISRAAAQRDIHVIDNNGILYKNAAAILKILEQYPHFRILAKIGSLPLIRDILPFGYRFIANNRHFLLGEFSRIFWIKIVAVLGLISSLLLSTQLWTHGRLFPHAPVFSPTHIPPLLETTLFGLLLCSLTLTLFAAKPQKFIYSSLGILTISVFLDQIRFQPWVYLYGATLLTLATFSWRYEDRERYNQTLNTARLIIATTYFFSGLQKVNLLFFGSVFPWMAEPLIHLFPTHMQILPLSFGTLIPILEMFIGVALLTKRFRTIGIGLTVCMLIFVLSTIGPLGHNWNSVVWPWNVGLFLLAILLFWRTEFNWKDVFAIKKSLFRGMIVTLFLILPFFSFLKLWDSYPSWSLYSGNTTYGTIQINPDAKMNIPASARPHLKQITPNQSELSLIHWSLAELHVPIYPETRVYKAITKQLCANEPDLILTLHERSLFMRPQTQRTYRCNEL